MGHHKMGSVPEIEHRLRFGIMCGGVKMAAWQAKAIRLLTEEKYQPALLIIDDRQLIKKSLLAKLCQYPYKNILYRIYVRYFHHPRSKKLVSLEGELEKVPKIRCTTSRKDYTDYFTPEDIRMIKEHQLDFILRFGFNIMRGDILHVAKYGIWSFHHGDEQQFRGGPPGFWEIYKKVPVTGAILQRLTERLDAGVVMRKGYFKTIRHSWSGQIDQLFFETAHWPLQVARGITRKEPGSLKGSPSDTKAPVYRNPKNAAMLRFLWILLTARFRFHWNRLFKAEEWNIGIIETPVCKLLTSEKLPQPRWIGPVRSHGYAADPFAMSGNDILRIFFESYDYRKASGTIDMIALDLKNNKVSGPVTSIEKTFHLAYPFVFRHNGTWFCIPESAQNHSADLYRWLEEEQRMVFVQTLMTGIDAVDVTLVEHQDLWWLFFTTKHLSDTHLFAAFSDELFGPYTMHQNNPVKTDIRGSRPAGTPFYCHGTLYRPTQDCSRTYGGEIVIQKIRVLSPVSFSEEPCKVIHPFNNSPYPSGIHTIAESGGYTLVDGKRYVFDWYHFRRELAVRMKKVFRTNQPK